MELEQNRRAAFAFGIAVPALQALRVLCLGHTPFTVMQWPIQGDAYVTGAFLLSAAALVKRSPERGRVALALAWGFGAGLLYRTFFEQLGDPERHAGSHAPVLVFKGLLLATAVWGAVAALLIPSATAPRGGVDGVAPPVR